MEDNEIIGLYWERSESAVSETDAKYKKLCLHVADNILSDRSDSEECLNDTYLVAFEELSLNGDVVAKHADLKDAAQTVAVGSLPAPPPAALPQTSDLVLPFSSLAVSGALATFIAIRLCRGGSAPRHVRKH